jgi:hypothetical protein
MHASIKTANAGRFLLLLCSGIFLLQAPPARAELLIVKANTTAEVIDAMLAASKSGRSTTIKVAPGHYSFTQTFSSTFGISALPPVSSVVSIIAVSAQTTTFDAGDLNARFITVLPRGRVVVSGLTLTNGATFCDSDCGQDGGGAAENAGGYLEFDNCYLTGNGTGQVQGVDTAFGGAIFNLSGYLLMSFTTVAGNTAVGWGGGVAMLAGQGLIEHSVISGNNLRAGAGESSFNLGGGVYLASAAAVVIYATTITGNVAGPTELDQGLAFGGGIYNDGGNVFMTNSAVTENVTQNTGSGGGVFNNGKMFIANSSVGGNTSGTSGGGIYNSSNLRLQGVTVTDNTVLSRYLLGDFGSSYPAGCMIAALQLCVTGGSGIWSEPGASLHTARAVIAGNSGGSNPSDCNGVAITDGYNALGSELNCTVIPGDALHGVPPADQVVAAAGLGSLIDSGKGGNAHYPLLAGSPLIDKGGSVDNECSPFDQIGRPRVNGSGHGGRALCDVGAIEYQPPNH